MYQNAWVALLRSHQVQQKSFWNGFYRQRLKGLFSLWALISLSSIFHEDCGNLPGTPVLTPTLTAQSRFWPQPLLAVELLGPEKAQSVEPCVCGFEGDWLQSS